MKNTFYCTIVAFALLSAGCGRATIGQRWSEERAAEWYAEQEWPVGCNYVPSYAINPFEFWQEETFDPGVIDHELGLAQGLGFNTIRIYLHDMLWEADREGFKGRVSRFMDIAEGHGLRIIMTLFTNGGNYQGVKFGRQPDAIPGVHSSQWIQSPGAPKVNNPAAWPPLKAYVQDVLRTWGDDDRILLWCLYNEPENFKHGAQSMGLLKAVFEWAREVDPSQPLSSPLWIRPGYKGESSKLDIISFLGENCDVMTFHCYYGAEELEMFIRMMKRFNRPMICQEYMGRPNSTFEECLPILKRERVGAINWGLVRGKCNFHLPWSSKPGDPDPEVWFHDIYNPDDTPYSQREIDFIRSMTAEKQ